jgi:hypothetical protein
MGRTRRKADLAWTLVEASGMVDPVQVEPIDEGRENVTKSRLTG